MTPTKTTKTTATSKMTGFSISGIFSTNQITYHFPHAHAWCWGDISACPPACPLLYTIRAHSIPYLAIQYHTRHGAAPPAYQCYHTGPCSWRYALAIPVL